MLYNPNNVALEASPLTTLIETYVGAQLCEMLGFRPPGHRNPVHFHGSTDEPEAWGHITCVSIPFYLLNVHS